MTLSVIRLVAWAAALAIGVAAPVGAGVPAGSLVSGSMVPGSTMSGSLSGSGSGSGSAQVSVLTANAVSLEAQVDAWIAELAKEEAFSSWRNATWRKAPLGPGQHGWIVYVHRAAGGGKPLGYLIVGATPEGGYALVEYGVGDTPLFSSEVLDRALRSDGLEGVVFTAKASVERLYFDPMHAFWKVSEAGVTRYADAANGAWLPVSATDVARLKVSTSPGEFLSGKRLHIMKQPGDPYMSLEWLEAPDAAIDGWDDFAAWFAARDDGEAVYAGSAFAGAVTTPVGVAGYHRWPAAGGSKPMSGYVALEQEGLTRYAPLERLLAVGDFR